VTAPALGYGTSPTTGQKKQDGEVLRDQRKEKGATRKKLRRGTQEEKIEKTKQRGKCGTAYICGGAETKKT